MHNGFQSHDDFVSSLSDGFANQFNEFVPEGMNLISNQDAYEYLLFLFGDDITLKKMHAVEDKKIEVLVDRLNDPEWNFQFNTDKVKICLENAVWQSTGKRIFKKQAWWKFWK